MVVVQFVNQRLKPLLTSLGFCGATKSRALSKQIRIDPPTRRFLS